MTTIYFIRHGQASFGAENYDKLSVQGEQQAQLLGQYLNKILNPTEVPYIVAGTMQRHLQTANISLAEYSLDGKVRSNPLWNEFNHQQVFAQYEPRFSNPAHLKQVIAQEKDPFQYLAHLFNNAIQRWVSGQHDTDYDETWLQFKRRIEHALQDLCQEAIDKNLKTIVVYTSGGVISMLVAKMLNLSIEKTFALTWAIANTSLTTLKIMDQQPCLLNFNEHYFIKAHDPQLLTWI